MPRRFTRHRLCRHWGRFRRAGFLDRGGSVFLVFGFRVGRELIPILRDSEE